MNCQTMENRFIITLLYESPLSPYYFIIIINKKQICNKK